MAVDDEPEPPLIDLGVRPPADDPERDALPPRRRAGTPRRFLALGAVGLLAVGFFGGMAVQRAATPDPVAAPSPAATYNPAPVRVIPQPTPACQTSYTHKDGGSVNVRTRCIGTIKTIAGRRIDVTLRDGSGVAFVVDSRTRFAGVDSLRELRTGQLVVVDLDQPNAEGAHAVSVRVQ